MSEYKVQSDGSVVCVRVQNSSNVNGQFWVTWPLLFAAAPHEHRIPWMRNALEREHDIIIQMASGDDTIITSTTRRNIGQEISHLGESVLFKLGTLSHR